jgi:hypothetical protein
VAVSLLALLAGCGGGGRGASVGSFCAEIRADQTQLNRSATPEYSQLVAAFDRLQQAAPTDVEADVATVDLAVKTAQQSPGRALLAFLNPSYLSAAGRFKAYAHDKCGITLTTDHVKMATGPATHFTAPATIIPSHPDMTLPDPCTLVTKATVSALFRTSATRERSVGTLGRACNWVGVDNGLTQRLRVWIVGDPFFYGLSTHPHARTLTGIGDRAFVDTSSILPDVMVSVQRGRTVLQLEYTEHSANGAVDLSTRADQLAAIAKRVVRDIS